jgi:hypothetical protein
MSSAFPVTNGIETVMPPPKGWEVNFENPTSATLVFKQTCWVTGFEMLLATAFLGQRIYSKLFLIRQFQIDDCTFG